MDILLVHQPQATVFKLALQEAVSRAVLSRYYRFPSPAHFGVPAMAIG
jgi:hypothetical protein